MKRNILFSSSTSLLSLLLLALAACLSACSEEETDIGLELQDPATYYNGTLDTAYGVAYTVFDTSLLTSGQSSALIGCYSDAVFGNSEAILYSQVVPSSGDVEFDEHCTIDSVVLSFAVTDIYSATSASKAFHNLHFEVYQLARGIMTDSAYYADSSIAVGTNCYFNGVVRMADADTMVVHLKLDESFNQLLNNRRYASAQEFLEASKGLRIRLVNDGNPTMITVNLAAAATRLAVYFKYSNDGETIDRDYEFVVGKTATHFSQYKNYYNGPLATFNSNRLDSIDGSRYIYLSPMGGTNVKISFDAFVRQFVEAHPYAVIHYAELLLPVADIAMDTKPDLIAAHKYYNDSTVAPIPDMYDVYTYQGYDGTYNSEQNCYRIRVTQHLQKIMSSGRDRGTLLVLNARRSSAAHTVLNGYDPNATGNKPIRLRFVYSE